MQLVSATPGASTLEAIVKLKRRQGSVTITAFSGGRMRAAKEVIGESDDVDFIEFGSLVGQFLALAGGMSGGLPGQGHIEAAVELACAQLPEDSPFHACSLTPGFQKRVVQCLSKLRGFGIEAAQMEAFSKEAEGGLARRLRDLAVIERGAARALENLGKRFNSERIRQCCELEAEIPFNGSILILAGCEDDPVNLEWIKWAVQSGVDVTVVTEVHPASPDRFFVGGSNIARLLGAEPSPVLRANDLTAHLFASGAYTGTPTHLDVQVSLMPDPLAESEWILRAALEEIQAGTQPERIAILARRMEDYAPLLEASAIRLGITLSVVRTMPLLAAGVTRFLLELLEALSHREPGRLGWILRSSYIGVSFEDQDSLDKAFRNARRDRGDSWASLELEIESQSDRWPWLQQLLKWRTAARAEQATLADWAERLKELGELPWLQKVYEGAERTSERDRYALNVAQRCLAELASIEKVSGARLTSLNGFVRQCRQRWTREEVFMPRSPGGVAVVGSAEEIGPAEVVFVVGMLEGVFPRRRSEDPILSDDDLAWLSERIGHALPDSHRKAKEERDEFYRACAAPSRKLVLTYPQTDDDKDNVKAFYLTEVERLMGITHPEVRSRTEWTPPEPISASDQRLREALSEPHLDPEPKIELETEEAKELLRAKPRDPHTLRELQTILSCPFRYATAGKLGIRSNRPQSRWNRLLRLPESIQLPAQPDAGTGTKRLNESLEELLEELHGEATPEDLTMMRLGGRRLIGEWVKREFEARDLWRRGAAYPEPSFKEGPLRSRFKTRNGEELHLDGAFPGMSTIGSHRVLNVFLGHEPMEDSRAPTFFERLREADRFYLGLAMAAIPNPREGVGLELDVAGGRRLFLTPRPIPPPAVSNSMTLSTIDEEERREWVNYVEEQCRIALVRLNKPEVDATPSDECRFCEMGELCRRSKEFSELIDPFEGDEVNA